MKYVYFFLLILPLFAKAQINEGLTTEERAYLYHIVKKSPILDNNFGRYFDYKGPDIRYPNKEINYDSVELLIINNPEMLIIRKSEIAKSPKGLIAEAANKMAIWELNKALLAKRGSEKEQESYSIELAVFEKFLLEKLPVNATKTKDEKTIPNPKIYSVINPGLSFDDKAALLESYKFLDENDWLVTMEAINYAINAYVSKRTLEIYLTIGGQTTDFVNVLVAAGDGSSTSGLLEEREKDEKGRWNRGLPKAVGLFPYQAKLSIPDAKKERHLEPLSITTNDFITCGNNRITNLHFDVWGYNAEKQTTVVIERNGVSYHLFGSGETRFLSPDSSFSKGATFQSIINELEFDKIAKVKEMIYGKRGYDYWIEYYKKKKDETELKIEKSEKNYSDISYQPIKTKKKAPKSVKKSKKKSSGGGPVDYQPTTISDRKQKGKGENNIVNLYNQFEAYKKKIKELEKEKQEAIDLLAIYQQKLDGYKRAMGYNWAKFTEKDGLYTFEDSTTFDILTQEFQFPASSKQENFEVRLIAIPYSALSDQADEVMLHINKTDAVPDFNARVQVELNDVFASDKWTLDRPLFAPEDSVSLRVFFEGMLDKKVDFKIIARGNGIGLWNGCQTIKDPKPQERKSYPGSNAEEKAQAKADTTFARLRLSELFILMDREITIEINSFTDPVVSNIEISNPVLKEAMSTYKLSKNDLLSAYRTATILSKMKAEINILAGTYLSREEAKVVIDRFNKVWEKTRISVGPTSFKLSDFQ